MLQQNSVDSWHFTQLELSIGWSDLHKLKTLFFAFQYKKEYINRVNSLVPYRLIVYMTGPQSLNGPFGSWAPIGS